MKTLINFKNILRIVLISLAATALVACDKDKGSNNSNYGYRYQNGYCYSPQGQIVDYSYCQNGGACNTGYNQNYSYQQPGYQQPGYGYQQPGYQQPGYGGQYCPPNGGGVQQQQCYGTYYYQTQWGYQLTQCSQYNNFCRGQILYSQQGYPVQCI